MTELEALADIERRRMAHETLSEDLLMERDQAIYDYLRPGKTHGPGATEIAKTLGIDRSWPYRIRDSFPERMKTYLIKRATSSTTDPETLKAAIAKAQQEADALIERIDQRAAREEAVKEKRRERDRARRARQLAEDPESAPAE